MRRVISRLFVALLGFGLGVLAHSVWTSLHLPLSHEEMPPVLVQRDNQLHKLYEAAAMTGDFEIRDAWRKELECLGEDGLLDALTVERGDTLWCVRNDGTEFPYNGKGFRDFMKAHLRWSVNNLSFLQEVGTAEKAKRYVASHRSPQGTW